ncbi:MAG: 30S ribosomal protein S16 [Acidobacteria bacterium]|nr:30S ribosomal protein S16 [Acidobacteriota bacterium]
MVKIRLRRAGGTNAPAYRLVVSESERVPTAKVVEELGYYDPTKTPTLLKLDAEKTRQWIAKGAQATPTVKRLLSSISKA